MADVHHHPQRRLTHAHDAVPRWAIIGAGLMIAAALALAFSARTGVLSPFTTAPQSEVVDTRQITFADTADGRVLIRDAASGAFVSEIEVGQENFIRGVLRGLARERMLNDVGAAPGFELVRWSDGRFTMRDLATGRVIDLGVFGPTNAEAFARLMTIEGASR
ncbi:MAG: photosynthetic complex assembly protein PuhC [Marivibrio sp.]|uniref:photosynthetic complex assembly protein PuhC n=1 Tax=Marivibrio sp. TaxID=2039719 RepID=UPI0032EECC87